MLLPEAGSPDTTMSFCDVTGVFTFPSPPAAYTEPPSPGACPLIASAWTEPGQFLRENRIYHAVALDPALPFEGRRHNINPEMRLAARPVAGMALMQM